LVLADLLVAEYGQAYPVLQWLTLLAGGKPRILFVYYGITPPSLWGTHNRETLDRALAQRGLVWCADAVLTPSRFAQRELLGPPGFPADRARSLPLPVDTEWFCPGVPKQPLRGLGDARILLFVGRLAPSKRVPILVEALDRLRDLTPPVHLVVVGDTGDLYGL